MIDRAHPAADAVVVRPAVAHDNRVVQAIWEASFAHDHREGAPRGGWTSVAWATQTRVLEVAGQAVGVVAVRSERTHAGATPSRIALLPEARSARLATTLIDVVIDMVKAIGGDRARLFLPSTNDWAISAAQARGFTVVRTIADMQLSAEVAVSAPRPVTGLSVRAMRDGEEPAVLQTLNRNWSGTWNFVPITSAMLAQDLEGQRQGMLLGVDDGGAIVATCHAVLDVNDAAADGQPRGWISNVTVAPEWRGLGVARAMLLAGIAYLRQRGAGPVGLGVDADDPAPFHLYQTVGFEVISQVRVWDLAVGGATL